MEAMRLEPIIPRHTTSSKVAALGLRAVLEAFAFEAQRELKTYPPARPWKRPPTSGIRKGGRRTGTLGKNWRLGRRGLDSIEVVNNTPYGSYVQGPTGKSGKAGGQTAVMADRGWPSVTNVAKNAAKRAGIIADIYPG